MKPTESQPVEPESEEELRKELERALSGESIDPMRILSIATRLADTPTDYVRFSVDASHVERLGLELVGKQGTALGELVKNAYDADATVVNVEIFQGETNSQIIIDDDGVGMSEADLRRAWMRLSTTEKIDRPRSLRYERLRAGKKGIGRFAAQRLGRALVLKTEQRDSPIGLEVRFDWDVDYQKGADLTQVINRVFTYEKPAPREGTRLEILGLRDTWDPKNLADAWRSVQLLQSPVRDRAIASPQDDTSADPGFQSFLRLESGNKQAALYDLETEFAKSAIAQISGSVDADGQARFEVHSATLNIHESENCSASFPLMRNVRLEADYFIFASDLMSGLKVGAATKVAQEIGGVRLYRNGFRVPPYGDPNNDWLRLAYDSARRNILVPANNANFVGRVYISSSDNPTLEETSSREGLIENASYAQLVEFTRACLRWAVQRVGWARERKTKASEPRKRPTDSVAERVTGLLSVLTQAASDRDAEAARRDIVAAVSAFEQSTRRDREESIKYEAMLRVLASLGLSISVFAHEVRAASSFADDSTAIFLQRARELELLLKAPDLEPMVARIDEGVRRIITLGDYLGGLTSYAGSRKLSATSLSGVVEEFQERLGGYLEGMGVRLDLDLGPPPLRTCPVHRSELDSVLFNLTSNALKAVKLAKPARPIIRLIAIQERNFIVLTVCDNGTGVPEDVRDRIFDAFFTTTGSEDDDDATSGAGLGLKIVADIASNYGGSVRVLDSPPDDMNTAIEFRMLAYSPSSST